MLFGRSSFLSFFSVALISLGAIVNAGDFDSRDRPWKVDSGLDKVRYAKSLQSHTKAGMRIVDFEQFNAGRTSSVAAVWVKAAKSDKWLTSDRMVLADFKKQHAANQKKGYALVDLEIDRTGATLEFAGVWLRAEKQFRTMMYFGMNDLMFSNRYGEMADRGYRLIDYEQYEANGKTAYAAVWKEKDEDEEVRFYRGLDKSQFEKVSQSLANSGFRLTEIEGDQNGRYVQFACAWSKLARDEKSEFAYHMLADEFYQKNAAYTGEGYRLTELEVYEFDKELRYAGSWIRTLDEAELQALDKKPVRDIFSRPNK